VHACGDPFIRDGCNEIALRYSTPRCATKKVLKSTKLHAAKAMRWWYNEMTLKVLKSTKLHAAKAMRWWYNEMTLLA
jgi:hypothetical protein